MFGGIVEGHRLPAPTPRRVVGIRGADQCAVVAGPGLVDDVAIKVPVTDKAARDAAWSGRAAAGDTPGIQRAGTRAPSAVVEPRLRPIRGRGGDGVAVSPVGVEGDQVMDGRRLAGDREIRHAGRAAEVRARDPVRRAGVGGAFVDLRQGRSGTVSADRPVTRVAVVEFVHQTAGVVMQADRFAVVVEVSGERPEPWPRRLGDGHIPSARDERSVGKGEVNPTAQCPPRQVDPNGQLVAELDPLAVLGRPGWIILQLVEGDDRIRRAACLRRDGYGQGKKEGQNGKSVGGNLHGARDRRSPNLETVGWNSLLR